MVGIGIQNCYNILSKMSSLEPKITRYTKKQENDQVKKQTTAFEKILKLDLVDLKAVCYNFQIIKIC